MYTSLLSIIHNKKNNMNTLTNIKIKLASLKTRIQAEEKFEALQKELSELREYIDSELTTLKTPEQNEDQEMMTKIKQSFKEFEDKLREKATDSLNYLENILADLEKKVSK